MKKSMKFTLMCALGLGVAMTLTSCLPNDYFGTWKWEYNNGEWAQISITDNGSKLVFLNNEGEGFTIENLTWTPLDNVAGTHSDDTAEYPRGYKVSGTLTAENWYANNIPNADETSATRVGDLAAQWLYIHTDKKSLMTGLWHGDGQGNRDVHYTYYGPYNKIDPTAKTVSVGAQSRQVNIGDYGVVAFPVTTTGITVGEHNVTVTNLPRDIYMGNQSKVKTGDDGKGTLYLLTSNPSAGNYLNMRLVIDGVQSETFTLTVTPVDAFIPVTGITGVPTMAKAGIPLTLTGTVLPSNATGKTITWKIASYDVGIWADVKDNTFTAQMPGEATVLAIVADGMAPGTEYRQYFPINVELGPIPITDITFTQKSDEMYAGHSHSFIVDITPANAGDKRVMWTTSNPAVVKFDDPILGTSGSLFGSNRNGNNITISANAPSGPVTITVTSVSNPSVKVQHTVNVRR